MVWQRLQTGRKQDWQVGRCRARLLLLLRWPAALCCCDGQHWHMTVCFECFCAGSPVYNIPQHVSTKVVSRVLVCVHRMHIRNDRSCVCMQRASLIHIFAHMESWYYLVFIYHLINSLLYCNKIAHTVVDRLYKAWTSTQFSIQTALCDEWSPVCVCLCVSMKVQANACSCVCPCCICACTRSGPRTSWLCIGVCLNECVCVCFSKLSFTIHWFWARGFSNRLWTLCNQFIFQTSCRVVNWTSVKSKNCRQWATRTAKENIFIQNITRSVAGLIFLKMKLL